MSGEITTWEAIEAARTSPQASTRIISGEAVQVVRAELDAGADFEPHSHPNEQITVVLSGRGEATVGEVRREVGPGSLVSIPPDVIHGMRVFDREPMTTLEIFDPPRRSLSHDAPS